MEWFRLYNEIIDDKKTATLSGDQFKLFIEILCLASKANNGGNTNHTIDEISWRLRRKINRSIQVLLDRKLIYLETIDQRLEVVCTNFAKRQRHSDNSSFRVSKHRKSKVNPEKPSNNGHSNPKCNVTSPLQETLQDCYKKRYSNALDTDTEKIRKELLTNNSSTTNVSTPPDLLEVVCSLFPKIGFAGKPDGKVLATVREWRDAGVLPADIRAGAEHVFSLGSHVKSQIDYLKPVVLNFAAARKEGRSYEEAIGNCELSESDKNRLAAEEVRREFAKRNKFGTG